MTDGIEFMPPGGTPKEELWKEATYGYCPKGIYAVAHSYDPLPRDFVISDSFFFQDMITKNYRESPWKVI
jgi:hypothetical protein